MPVHGAPIDLLAWGRVGDPGLLPRHGNGAHGRGYSVIVPSLQPGRRLRAINFSGLGGSGWRTAAAQLRREASAPALRRHKSTA